MTGHFEELRGRVIQCLLWFFVFSGIAYHYVDPILTWLAKPVGDFIFTAPTEALFVRLKISMGCGALFTFPISLYHMWRFIEIALKRKERSIVLMTVPISCLLFFLGMGLGLFVIVPTAAKMLLQFSSPHLRPFISIQSYLSFLFWMIMGFGILFQLPLVIVVLCQAGVVKPETLSLYRRHVFIGILIIAAVLTPGPDIFSQLTLTLPTYLLFEVSLFIAHRLKKG